MSLPAEEETLEFALAFVDALDFDNDLSASSDTASSSSSGPRSDSPHCLSPYEPPATLHDESIVTDLPHLNGGLRVMIRSAENQRLSAYQIQPQDMQDNSALTKRQSDRPRSNAAAAKRLRARKKAEAIALRKEVSALEAKLVRLQLGPRLNGLKHASKFRQTIEEEINDTGESQGDKSVPTWLNVAARQARERFESEALNLRLRDAADEHLRIIKSLQAVLGKRHGFDLLWPSLNRNLYNDAVFTTENTARAELRGRMDDMYLESESVTQSFCAEDRDNVTITMDNKVHPHFGWYIEVKTNTPLRCGLREAGNDVWNRVSHSRTQVSNNYRLKVRELTDDSFEKSYAMLLDGPNGPLELNGFSLVRKYEEPHRCVVVFKSIIYASTKGLVFRENGWVVVPPNPRAEETKFPTTIQACNQILGDPSNEESRLRDPEREQLRESIMQLLGDRTWTMFQQIQNLALEEFA